MKRIPCDRLGQVNLDGSLRGASRHVYVIDTSKSYFRAVCKLCGYVNLTGSNIMKDQVFKPNSQKEGREILSRSRFKAVITPGQTKLG